MSSRAAAVARGFGWLLVAAGVVVLLYLAYSLLFTNIATDRAQDRLEREWQAVVGQPGRSLPAGTDIVAGQPEPPGSAADERAGQVVEPTLSDSGTRPQPIPRVDAGDAVAVLQFVRPGDQEAPVHAEPLFVVQGVGAAELAQGPGHYPGTADPGGEGNFAIAGHRTTYGAPFFNLDELRSGDRILVTDRRGDRHTYRVRSQRVVAPGERWVIGPDPLNSGNPTLTLTTCEPRFSARQRLIVFAELML